MVNINSNQKIFRKDIGKLGVANESKKTLPETILLQDGSEIRDSVQVKESWKAHFQDILNRSDTLQLPADTNLTLDPQRQPLEDSL